MAILLTILKIIGIILLCILGLLVFLAVAVLLYPVGYRICGSVQERTDINVTLKWLFSAVRFRFRMKGDDKKVWIRILGIPFVLFPQKQKMRRRKAKKQGPKSVRRDMQECKSQELHIPIEEPETPMPERKTGFSVRKRFARFWKSIKSFFCSTTRIPSFFRSFFHRLKSGRDILAEESSRRVAALLLEEMKNLFRHYHPRKLAADAVYCAADPALTGQILGAVSILPFLYRYPVVITPDFMGEELYVKGSFQIKGHVQMVYMLKTAIRIYTNQDVKKIIAESRTL